MRKLITCLLLTFFTFAGEGGMDVGGGDAILCKRTPDSTFYTSVNLADIHTTLRFQSPYGFSFGRYRYGEELALLYIQNWIRENSSQNFSQLFDETLALQTYEFVDNLPELDDDNILYIPRQYYLRFEGGDNITQEFHNCEKRQLAIQNLETGVVRVQRSIYEALSGIQRAFLKVHEVYIYLYSETQSKKAIRDRVNLLFETMNLAEDHRNDEIINLLRQSLPSDWSELNKEVILTYAEVRSGWEGKNIEEIVSWFLGDQDSQVPGAYGRGIMSIFNGPSIDYRQIFQQTLLRLGQKGSCGNVVTNELATHRRDMQSYYNRRLSIIRSSRQMNMGRVIRGRRLKREALFEYFEIACSRWERLIRN